MRDMKQDDWLAERLAVLKPGWRGRLWLHAAEEAEGRGGGEVIGTIVDEPIFDDDEDAADDPTLTICANHRNGRFVAITDEPCFNIRLSRIVAIESM